MTTKTAKLNFAQGEKIRANIRCVVNAMDVRAEQRDGRSVIVIPSFTLPDNIIMNGILYPADEIEKSYKTLEGTPAPLGHPTVNGNFVPAASMLGLNIGYFGAWNANVTKVEGRVFIEKVIDVKRAQESPQGRRVLEALDAHKPIHTSTGLMMNIRECTTSDLADYEGFDMVFDHDAILLDEQGAATPEQGVGMLVNGVKTVVINSDLADADSEETDYIGVEFLSALGRQEAVGRWARIKDAVMDMIKSDRTTESQPIAEEAEKMDFTEDDIKKMSTAMGIDKLMEAVNSVSETVKDLALKTAQNSEVVAAIDEDRKAKADALVAEAVDLKLINEADAKNTPSTVLQSLINGAKKTETPLPSFGINGAFNGSNDAVDLSSDWENA
jgi:uncharacterized protein YoxC